MCRDYAEYDQDSSNNSTEDGEEEEQEPTTIADKPFDTLYSHDSWVKIQFIYLQLFRQPVPLQLQLQQPLSLTLPF